MMFGYFYGICDATVIDIHGGCCIGTDFPVSHGAQQKNVSTTLPT